LYKSHIGHNSKEGDIETTNKNKAKRDSKFIHIKQRGHQLKFSVIRQHTNQKHFKFIFFYTVDLELCGCKLYICFRRIKVYIWFMGLERNLCAIKIRENGIYIDMTWNIEPFLFIVNVTSLHLIPLFCYDIDCAYSLNSKNNYRVFRETIVSVCLIQRYKFLDITLLHLYVIFHIF
jgi:hypothetical protein